MWFQDGETHAFHRIGRKNHLVYGWARKGTRPRQPQDQRYESAYLFAAVCPGQAKGAALVLPHVDHRTMSRHLDEISRAVAKGAHAVLVLDRAAWHTATKLQVPDNITLMPLPPVSSELNPVENVWQYLRQTRLSNRDFEAYEDIVDACCDAWNKFVADRDNIRSIATRDWATLPVAN